MAQAVETLFFIYFVTEPRNGVLFVFDLTFEGNPGPWKDRSLGLAGGLAGWLAIQCSGMVEHFAAEIQTKQKENALAVDFS